jgi:7-carboxy-7-deazaguanine synthase
MSAAIARAPVSSAQTLRLRITEIFHSLQGETSRVGLPTTFIRLTGCPLRCGYCDTAYAFHGGQSHTLDAILAKVKDFGARHVTVTGGEPLAQRGCLDLLAALCDAGYDVSLETSGALDISAVDGRVSRIVDIKTPGSGEMGRNLWSNLLYLRAHDELKFVLCDRADYEWARDLIAQRGLTALCPVLMSPSFGQLEPRQLAEWILADRLSVRMQLQLHKLLWGDVPGH